MFAGVEGHPDFWENTAGRGDSAPLHRHSWATWELILEGRISYVVDGEEFIAEAGDFVYTPPNAAHTYVVESETSRMVGFNHPAPRFAEIQFGAMDLFAAPGGPDMQKLVQFAAEHGVEVLGPPIQPRT